MEDFDFFDLMVSIHTSAWEVTKIKLEQIIFTRVSIHTSAWEVTSTRFLKPRLCSCFNPHLRVGGDQDVRVS